MESPYVAASDILVEAEVVFAFNKVFVILDFERRSV